MAQKKERLVICPRCKGAGKVPMDGVTFGDRVRARREELGLTQIELARAVNLSRGQIANIETSRVDTTMKQLPVFAAALQCEAAELIP